MTGHPDYTAHIYEGHGYLPVGWWFVIFTPIISALIYGPILARWGEEARGSGIPEVMLAVRRQGGRIGGHIAIVKIICSSLTLGGGGSVGREGPVVQTGASIGSWIAQILRLPRNTMIVMAGCGAGAGVAATYNAPLSGTVFALEAILVTVNTQTIGLVVICSVSSAVTAKILLGDRIILSIPSDLAVAATSDMVWVALIGIIAGLIGVLFSKTMFGFSDLYARFYRGPTWAKPIVGACILGPMLLVFPYMYGLGYPIQLNVLNGNYSLWFLVYLLAGRIIMTSLTIGFGGSGGVFAPSLFNGACLGAFIGTLVTPISSTSIATYGVIGMGAGFAGAARLPLSAVLIIVEMTGQYSLILPLMLATAFATVVSRFLSRKTIFTEKLARRGANLDDPVYSTLMASRTAKQFMSEPPLVLSQDTTISEAAAIMRTSHSPAAPIVRDEEHPLFVGCVSPLMIARAQQRGLSPYTPLSELKLDKTHVRDSFLPSRILRTVLDSPLQAVPVLHEGELVGWISQEDLIRLVYLQQTHAIEQREAQSSWGSRMLKRWEEKHPHPNSKATG